MAKLLKNHGWVQTRGGNHVVKLDKDGERPIYDDYPSGD
jgi:hypothetical protein